MGVLNKNEQIIPEHQFKTAQDTWRLIDVPIITRTTFKCTTLTPGPLHRFYFYLALTLPILMLGVMLFLMLNFLEIV